MNDNENRTQSESQNAQIAAYLQQGHSITAMEALAKFKCMRLASRISDLRTQWGLPIKSERITTPGGKTVAIYRLDK